MAKLVQPPPKFIVPEWHQSNSHKFNSAEKERQVSEKLIDESDRLIEETHVTTEKSQRNTEHKLNSRIIDIKGWVDKLNWKRKDVQNETDFVIEHRGRLQRALEATVEPANIAQACLAFREGRAGIDLVYDKPETELLKEGEVLRGVQNLFKRDIEQATEQIRRNRQAIYDIDCDLKDKAQALSIDEHCATINNNSAQLSLHPHKVRVEPNSTSVLGWQNYTDANINRGEMERINSSKLRSVIDMSLKTACDDMRFQQTACNRAFEDRVKETKRIKAKLEDHLAKVLVEIGEQEKNIEDLKKGIEDKMAAMMVAQTRLEARAHRPNVELCRDPVQYALIAEVDEIKVNVHKIEQRLAQSEKELLLLVRNQRILEEDIQVKINSLYIDEVECGQLRSKIIHNYH